ncbi:sulfite oxidase [Gracilaria domingensis]|nr:sulfite oxidase [Gracilaria domingensis]
MQAPVIDGEDYELTVVRLEGEVFGELALEDLNTKFPKHTVASGLQCTGNRRTELNELRKVKGGTWDVGAIGNAVWSGARLRGVLNYVQQQNGKGALMDGVQHVCGRAAQGERRGAGVRDERRGAAARPQVPDPGAGAGCGGRAQCELSGQGVDAAGEAGEADYGAAPSIQKMLLIPTMRPCPKISHELFDLHVRIEKILRPLASLDKPQSLQKFTKKANRSSPSIVAAKDLAFGKFATVTALVNMLFDGGKNLQPPQVSNHSNDNPSEGHTAHTPSEPNANDITYASMVRRQIPPPAATLKPSRLRSINSNIDSGEQEKDIDFNDFTISRKSLKRMRRIAIGACGQRWTAGSNHCYENVRNPHVPGLRTTQLPPEHRASVLPLPPKQYFSDALRLHEEDCYNKFKNRHPDSNLQPINPPSRARSRQAANDGGNGENDRPKGELLRRRTTATDAAHRNDASLDNPLRNTAEETLPIPSGSHALRRKSTLSGALRLPPSQRGQSNTNDVVMVPNAAQVGDSNNRFSALGAAEAANNPEDWVGENDLSLE